MQPRPLRGLGRSRPRTSLEPPLFSAPMAVSFWTVLGGVCLLLGVPVVALVSDPVLGRGFAFLAGAGGAFLIVGILESISERGRPKDEPRP